MIARSLFWANLGHCGNLIDNALQYTPVGCEITLGLEYTAELITLTIQDTADSGLGRE